MAKGRKHHRHRAEERRGYFGGVYGVGYLGQSYCLNPDQFGYQTAQTPDGTMTTATDGGQSSGGDATGGASAP